MLLAELRVELARYAKKMYDSQLVRATQGNISIRDPHTGFICLTPSGTDYLTLTAADIVVVDEHGKTVEGRGQPTVELPLHTLILRRRRDIHCVMHTHSPYATAFGVIYQPVPLVLADSAHCLGHEVPVAPFRPSGTVEFAELIAEVLGEDSAVIWGNHGAMVVGASLSRAFAAAHALEDNARVYTLARQLGTPALLPADAIAHLHRLWLENSEQKVTGEATQDQGVLR